MDLLHLPRDLGVDAVAAALVHVEIVVPGKLIGPHQRVKIRFGAGLKQFARFGDMFVVAAQAHQQIASADQRGAQAPPPERNRIWPPPPTSANNAGASAAATSAQPMGVMSDFSGDVSSPPERKRAQNAQQFFGPFHRLRIGLVQPVKLRRVFDAKGMKQQDDFRQIAALDFRRVAFRPVQMRRLRSKAGGRRPARCAPPCPPAARPRRG